MNTETIRKRFRNGNQLDSIGESHRMIYQLCDSHDELERKLKIAETALEKVNDDTLFIAMLHAAKDALKQIRGEEC